MRTYVLLSLSLLGLTLACREDAASPTAPDTPAALATTASTLVFTELSAGSVHTCGVTSDNRLFCWGDNTGGQLGDGTTTNRFAPVPVGGGRRFRHVSAGYRSTCGITTDYRAYCWGENDRGQLGDGAFGTHLTPVAVTGGHLFRQVQNMWAHTCAVTSSGDRAFCWGDNGGGQLGIGNNTGPEILVLDGHPFPLSTKPVAMLGGFTFRHVTVGYGHTCGVTTANRVFCWGSNRYGQVGDSSAGWKTFKPVQVAGNRQYKQVDAGLDYSCAVTTGNRAFCWGHGQFGVLGTGSESSSRYPKLVSGGLSFERVSASNGFRTCAETTTNRAFCWGQNYGTLGDGTTTGTNRLTPVAVVGGLSFRQVSAGGTHNCGHTPEGRAYCWGFNLQGQLGIGTTSVVVSPTPVPVAGPM